MILLSIDAEQYPNSPRAWSISGLTLGKVNLIVGKNASGKTRALNSIHNLGKLLGARQKAEIYASAILHATFEHDGRALRYELEITSRKVTKERFQDGSRVLLNRGAEGAGTIFHEKENRDFEFQVPETEAAAVARLDKIQHAFLQPLAEWGAGTRHYPFGDSMGRTFLALLVPGGPEPDPWDVNAVIALFRQAEKKSPGHLARAVTSDLNTVGYQVEEVGVMPPTDVQIQTSLSLPVTPMVMFVKEKDLAARTEQTDMSQGMFRVLSILVHLNYAVMTSKPSCIIIDDIGEGLDYERSCLLIDLLRKRALESSVQLIMATNDRFVMNRVPLEEWSVLQREGARVRVRNYANSKSIFDQFKFTGLNNFDFLAMDFVNEDETGLFEEQEEQQELVPERTE